MECNAIIAEQGVLNQRLYRIKSGEVRMERRGNNNTVLLGVNEMFGELSLLDKYAFTTSTVVANSALGTELYCMEAAFLYQLFESEPDLGRRFFEMLALKLSARLRQLNKATSRQSSVTRRDSMSVNACLKYHGRRRRSMGSLANSPLSRSQSNMDKELTAAHANANTSTLDGCASPSIFGAALVSHSVGNVPAYALQSTSSASPPVLSSQIRWVVVCGRVCV
jgi:CRP-like cAMP-binding protein